MSSRRSTALKLLTSPPEVADYLDAGRGAICNLLNTAALAAIHSAEGAESLSTNSSASMSRRLLLE